MHKENWIKPEIKHQVPTRWGWVVWHPHNFKLGKNVDIGYGTYIQAESGVIIEDDVQIGSHCSIYSVSTIDDKRGKVHIEHGARIGTHCVIMPGITIGRNAVVGACSFVRENVLPNSIVMGIPAKRKGERRYERYCLWWPWFNRKSCNK